MISALLLLLAQQPQTQLASRDPVSQYLTDLEQAGILGAPTSAPSLPQLHAWNLQTSESPSILPIERSAPMCGHHAFMTFSLPLWP